MTDYYVYLYLRPDMTPYYVGKGRRNRAYSKVRIVSVPSDLSRIKFIKTGLSESDAYMWEWFWVQEFGRKDTGTGCLRNLSDGGDGSAAGRISERRGKTYEEIFGAEKAAILRRARAKQNQERNPFRGKVHSDATRQMISALAKARGPRPGTPHSDASNEQNKTAQLSRFPVRQCPHCSLVGGGTAMNRYHFDRCKTKEGIGA